MRSVFVIQAIIHQQLDHIPAFDRERGDPCCQTLYIIGAFLFGVMCLGATSGTSSDNEQIMRISYSVGMVVSFLLSGIGRRIFHIKKDVVESKGTVPAILSRINCLRFYLSIFMYAALAFTSYVMVSDGELLHWVIGLAVCALFFIMVRRTCPRCGRKLRFTKKRETARI